MVLSGVWVEVVALVAAFVVAVVTTPAGVSGAVLLLPFQVSVLSVSASCGQAWPPPCNETRLEALIYHQFATCVPCRKGDGKAEGGSFWQGGRRGGVCCGSRCPAMAGPVAARPVPTSSRARSRS